MQTVNRVKTVSILVCMLATAILATSAAAREDAILAVAYGNGVHAYYAGDYPRSYDELSDAIEGGTKDPRAFYFRGLAALKLGRLDEADADFALGADAEAKGQGNWPVGRALERIQGESRLQLEKHRVRARLAAVQQRREAIIRHYSQVESARPDVQRNRRPENLPGPASADATEPMPADESVVVPSVPKTEEEAELMPEKPAPKPSKSDDPFGDDPF